MISLAVYILAWLCVPAAYSSNTNRTAATSWSKGLQPSLKVPRVGETVKQYCNTTNMTGRVQWQKFEKGRWKNLTAKYQDRLSPTQVYLKLRNITVQDSGKYRCLDSHNVNYVAVVLKIGRPDKPKYPNINCKSSMYLTVCQLVWARPLYTGYSNPHTVNYIIKYKPQGGKTTRMSVETTQLTLYLPPISRVYYINVWSNSTAGRSAHPYTVKVVIPQRSGSWRQKPRQKLQPVTPTTILEEESKTVPTAQIIVISIAALMCSLPLILTASLVISTSCRRKEQQI